VASIRMASGRSEPSRTCAPVVLALVPHLRHGEIISSSPPPLDPWRPETKSGRLGAVLGPRDSGQQRSTTVPHRQPTPSSSAIIGGEGAAGPYMACKESRHGSALPCPAADRCLVAEDRSAEGVRDRTGPNPFSVRAGPAAEGRTVDNDGQERSPNVRQTRRPLTLEPPDLGWRGQATRRSSLPSRLPRALRGLAHEALCRRGTGRTPRSRPEGLLKTVDL
jgi:hypothetical protein